MLKIQISLLMLVFALSSALTSTAFGVVYEETSLAEIITKFSPDNKSLVVFDIDGTLVDKRIAPPSIAEWSNTAIAYLQKNGMPADVAKKNVEDYVQLRSGKVAFNASEKTTVSIITALQKSGVTVIALTSQPPAVAVMTVYELNRIGINFKSSSSALQKNPFGANGDVGLASGVVFNGFHHDKGTTMKAFITANAFSPDKLIFIDNETENIEAMEAAYANDRLPHFSIHYAPHGLHGLKAIADCKEQLP